MLDENDLERYANQLIMPEIEEEGQSILLKSKILINHFSKIFVIKPNMRIGQIVFAPIVKIQLQLGDVNIFETKRSSKGFGSTGLE